MADTFPAHAASPPEPKLRRAVQSRAGVQVGALQPRHNAGSAATGESQPLYTFTFGVIAYPRSQMGAVYGINDSGKMVGGYNNTDIEIYTADHGLELKKNNFVTIDYPGAVQSELFAINKSGEMVGAFADSSGNIHGYELAKGVYTQLDYLGVTNFTVALGINASGEITGVYDDPKTGNATGFLLSNGTYTSITIPGAISTYTENLNKNGVIAGYYFDSGGNSHGFTYDHGTITTIDYGNDYPNTYLAGINDSGLIVGGYGSSITINSVPYLWEHGFLYSNGTFSTFDAPFGDVEVTQPWGMNNKGEIVGGYVDSQGMLYGFYLKPQ
jgi:uncharacterized membrane protein